MKTTHDIGIVIDCEHDSADSLNEQTIDLAASLGFDRAELPNEDSEDYGQILSDDADAAVDFLNDLDDLLPFCSYFFENNCLFCLPNIEAAQDDVGFVSSRKQDYPDDDFRGEWLHINDHGNCTLYVRGNDGTDREIWSVV